MRDLDTINVMARSSKFAFTITLPLPLIMGIFAFGLADGAAPNTPLSKNYLEIFSISLMALSLAAIPIPHIFQWNWEAKYVGALMFQMTSTSIIGIYSVLCIAQYSTLPFFWRILITIIFSLIIIRWILKITDDYTNLYLDKDIIFYVYEEEPDAVYYLKQADQEISKKFKLDPYPNSKYSLIFFISAFLMVPFASNISNFFGIPFTHIFLAIFFIPLDLMFIGIGTKMYLAYFFYPNKIKRLLKKPVYADLTSKPRNPLIPVNNKFSRR